MIVILFYGTVSFHYKELDLFQHNMRLSCIRKQKSQRLQLFLCRILCILLLRLVSSCIMHLLHYYLLVLWEYSTCYFLSGGICWILAALLLLLMMFWYVCDLSLAFFFWYSTAIDSLDFEFGIYFIRAFHASLVFQVYVYTNLTMFCHNVLFLL